MKSLVHRAGQCSLELVGPRHQLCRNESEFNPSKSTGNVTIDRLSLITDTFGINNEIITPKPKAKKWIYKYSSS